jgi:hypothetical protein
LTSGAARSIRPLNALVRTNTDATTASNRGAIARTRSISDSVDRSESSTAVTVGHRLRNSGMNVRLGAEIRQPDG